MNPNQIREAVAGIVDVKPKDRRNFRITLGDGSSFDVERIGIGWRICVPIGEKVCIASCNAGWGRKVRIHTENIDPNKIHIQVGDPSGHEFHVRASVAVRPEDIISIEPLGVDE